MSEARGESKPPVTQAKRREGRRGGPRGWGERGGDSLHQYCIEKGAQGVGRQGGGEGEESRERAG